MRGPGNAYFSAEAEDPPKEGGTGGDLDDGPEVPSVDDFCVDTLPKAVYDIPHNIIVAQQLNGTGLLRVHVEHRPYIFSCIEIRGRYGGVF